MSYDSWKTNAPDPGTVDDYDDVFRELENLRQERGALEADEYYYENQLAETVAEIQNLDRRILDLEDKLDSMDGGNR